MRVCIIGYKNHSKRLELILQSLGYIDIFLFNYNVDNWETTINDYDIFFISSPNNTHVDWIHKINKLGKYIFCEKPPATSLIDLETISLYNPKLYFNFNYRFTKLANIIKEFIDNKEIGEPVYINCISCTGLSFKESFKDNWRFNGDNIFSSVLGNVGIHYIDMIGFLFNGIDSIKINNSHITSKSLPDTSKITINTQNVSGDILVSYAAPFHNEVKVIFTNGIIYMQDGVISVATPRDTFDSNQRFISPTSKIIYKSKSIKEYFDNSLKESIKFFMQHVKDNSSIPLELHKQSIKTTQIIINET